MGVEVSRSRASETVSMLISSFVERIASERGPKEAMIAGYVLREVLLGGSRDPRLLRLAAYYVGTMVSLGEEDEKLRRKLGTVLASPENVAINFLEAFRRDRGSDRQGNPRELFYISLIFAGA
jgi:hypothetical protein